jgi:hypothetical protein
MRLQGSNLASGTLSLVAPRALDSFLEPLRLKATLEQPQIGRIYRVQEVEGVFGLEVMLPT